MPSSTVFSSNAIDTFSNVITGEPASCCGAVRCSIVLGGAAIRITKSAIREYGHQQLGYDQIHYQYQHRRSHYRLRRSPAHTLGTAAGSHPVIATDGGDNEAKEQWLHQAHEDILKYQELPGRAPILPPIETKQSG